MIKYILKNQRRYILKNKGNIIYKVSVYMFTPLVVRTPSLSPLSRFIH